MTKQVSNCAKKGYLDNLYSNMDTYYKDFTLIVGKPCVFQQVAPDGMHAVFFEDDGDTGYFYACDLSKRQDPKGPILEAMSIYDVKNVTDKNKPSVVSLVWTADSNQALLLINGYPHGVFDYSIPRGYCRRNFPKPGKWGTDFLWSDMALKPFVKDKK